MTDNGYFFKLTGSICFGNKENNRKKNLLGHALGVEGSLVAGGISPIWTEVSKTNC